MAWYHEYQFAEVRDPLYPRLKGFGLPIIRYEIREDKIIALELQLKDNQTIWFPREHLILYKCGKDLVTKSEGRGTAKGWKKLLQKFNLKKR